MLRECGSALRLLIIRRADRTFAKQRGYARLFGYRRSYRFARLKFVVVFLEKPIEQNRGPIENIFPGLPLVPELEGDAAGRPLDLPSIRLGTLFIADDARNTVRFP